MPWSCAPDICEMQRGASRHAGKISRSATQTISPCRPATFIIPPHHPRILSGDRKFLRSRARDAPRFQFSCIFFFFHIVSWGRMCAFEVTLHANVNLTLTSPIVTRTPSSPRPCTLTSAWMADFVLAHGKKRNKYNLEISARAVCNRIRSNS